MGTGLQCVLVLCQVSRRPAALLALGKVRGRVKKGRRAQAEGEPGQRRLQQEWLLRQCLWGGCQRPLEGLCRPVLAEAVGGTLPGQECSPG